MRIDKDFMLTAQEYKKLTFLFIGWRAVLFLIGVIAPLFLEYRPSFPYFDKLLPLYSVPQWFYSWANFDGVHYITIAEHGYIGTGSIQAFFPLFPYLILHTLKYLSGDWFNTLVVGLILTNLSTLVLLYVWFAFIKKIRNSDIAWNSTIALLLFPTSLFFAALYTESLFLFLVILSFYFAKNKLWLWAGVVAALASATRIVGVFLVPALIIELITQEVEIARIWAFSRMKHKGFAVYFDVLRIIKVFLIKNWINIISILLGSLGLLFYMIYLNLVFKDPLYFAHVQASFGSGRSTDNLVSYPQVLYRALRILMTARPFDLRYWSYVQEFLSGTVVLLGLFVASRYVRFSYLFFALGAFILPTLTGTFSSMPRYVLVCFPLFIGFGELMQNHKKVGIVCLALSSLLLILNAVLFIQGYWVA